MLKFNSRMLNATFESMEINKKNRLIGHYIVQYASQYISFSAYCELSLYKDHRIKIHF